MQLMLQSGHALRRAGCVQDGEKGLIAENRALDAGKLGVDGLPCGTVYDAGDGEVYIILKGFYGKLGVLVKDAGEGNVWDLADKLGIDREHILQVCDLGAGVAGGEAVGIFPREAEEGLTLGL